MRESELERQIATIALLHDPVRRGLYRYVRGRRRDVSRDEAARALRVSRNLAAFHLDKLVAQNLLDASYRRLTGRAVRALAGRPSCTAARTGTSTSHFPRAAMRSLDTCSR